MAASANVLRKGTKGQQMRGVIRLKRVYDKPSRSDGLRILVERLWPRGLTKDRAKVDIWLRDVAPSAALRKWFGHDPARWEEFQRKYRQELRQAGDVLKLLHYRASEGPVTFVYAASDPQRNSALLLKEFLETEKL
jgi:uncharacterized protein YeaO (DUF488 family)